MCSAIASILLFFVAHVYTKDLEARFPANAQDSPGKFVDKLADKLVDRADQSLQAWLLHRTDLELTTLAKSPGHFQLQAKLPVGMTVPRLPLLMTVPRVTPTQFKATSKPAGIDFVCLSRFCAVYAAAPTQQLLEQPKKPTGGGYGMFMKAKRPQFAELCKGKPVTEVTKMGGEEWKKLSDSDKAPYVKQYEAAKVKYEKDMAAFIAAGGEKKPPKSKKKSATETKEKKKKDPNAPKKPTGGAFGVWLGENRASIVKSLPAGHKVTEVTKAASVQWNAMDEKAKEPWQAKFVKKSAAYKVAMEEYVKNKPKDGEDESGDR